MSSNSFFSICQKNPGTQKESTKTEIYKCCLQTCLRHSSEADVCYPMCAQIFPGIKDQCALEEKCWNDNNGEFRKECVKSRYDSIRSCCLKKCERKHNRFTKLEFDCESYCATYQLEGI
jgi:hypothetical protein